jgi:hypothetical protein
MKPLFLRELYQVVRIAKKVQTLCEYATMLYYVYIAYLVVNTAAPSPFSILKWVLLVHTSYSTRSVT